MTMRVLVVGGAGMLGHMMWRHARERFDAWVTLRGRWAEYEPLGLFERTRTFDGIDAGDLQPLVRAFADARPDVVVNCVGIVKQLAAAKDPVPSVTINALFPHRLADLCRAAGARLVHVSTDCVFSGERGRYTEEDRADADDLYGRSKHMGEVGSPHVTLRTSMIGRELRSATGLVEWFLAQRGRSVQGYAGAVFSGLTTAALAQTIGDVIERHRDLAGLYHVAAAPIDKLTLLTRLRSAFDVDVTIDPAALPRIDRSLDGGRFAAATGFAAPSWDAMIAGLAADRAPYDNWRRQ